ncbi:ABC transporter ATP-binding protein [Nesterenkonia jeotgali]|uniref:Teichoic acid transport system ATP-binding protein n=1 Tax=Nesterenkonia jeotgali TaxID=317018 RepID=A0A839FTY5_9MICC|nr:ABC transporter ATP-binding protein [Nesterenkonia jeotgali]MBA8920544.1 teichoic acid transport system ATP-binding protein [Nesterenkonia jeotgali]
MSTSTSRVSPRQPASESDLIAEDLAIAFDDAEQALHDGDDRSFTQPAPVVHRIDPENVCMVVDDASMTYRVRSSSGNRDSGGRIARGLKRITGSGWAEVHALSNLSFIVNRGESVGVIGTNGSGKSTLMKLLTGKVRPTSGEVYATSTPVMLGVNAALVKEISGRENIRLGCLAMGLSPEQTAAKYDQIVEISGLSDALEMPLKTYSSGMSSRLQFAIATSVDPDILLIDEALNTGDAQFRARTKQRLDEVRANAGAVFLVSHSLGTIKQMCTRVIWIEQGEMLADGDPQWVCEQYEEYTSHKSNGRMRAAKVVYERTRLQLDPVTIDFTGGSRPKK